MDSARSECTQKCLFDNSGMLCVSDIGICAVPISTSEFVPLMKQYLRYIGPVLVTSIFLGAMYLLYLKLRVYSLDQIRDSLLLIPHWRIWASVGLMIVNYIILIGYDWLALIAIQKPLPAGRTALVSFVGQAISYNFGALLGGTTVRYRFYTAWGFSVHDIVRLVLMLAVTFWVGALGLCGIVFLVAPPEIPAELLAKMPIKDVRILGAMLLFVTCAYLVACHFIRKPLYVFKKEFHFPPLKIAIWQVIVAGVDLIVAAGCMYVLLPASLDVSFIQFLPSYLMAQVAVVLTHVPGGVGVFELVILHLTHTPHENIVVAAVLSFRIIYFILPLLMAALLFALYEVRQRKNALRDAGRWLSALANSINAWATFGAGLLLLITTILPIWKQGTLSLVVHWPAWVTLTLHWLSLFCGALLLFLAYGLERRQVIAWRLSVLFLCLGSVSALLKGLHVFGLVAVLLPLLVVLVSKRHFYRKSFFWEEAFPLHWLWPIWISLLVCLGIAATFVSGKSHAWSWAADMDAAANLYTLLSVYVVVMALWFWRISKRRRAA